MGEPMERDGRLAVPGLAQDEDGVTIDLVSIGVVDEEGREFYAVSTEFDPAKAGQWVRENVLDKLPSTGDKAWRDRTRIRADLMKFLSPSGEASFGCPAIIAAAASRSAILGAS